ncbi:hypothetical protein F5H01DRAFT_356238, partial [Linnemannia elongata]
MIDEGREREDVAYFLLPSGLFPFCSSSSTSHFFFYFFGPSFRDGGTLVINSQSLTFLFLLSRIETAWLRRTHTNTSISTSRHHHHHHRHH